MPVQRCSKATVRGGARGKPARSRSRSPRGGSMRKIYWVIKTFVYLLFFVAATDERTFKGLHSVAAATSAAMRRYIDVCFTQFFLIYNIRWSPWSWTWWQKSKVFQGRWQVRAMWASQQMGTLQRTATVVQQQPGWFVSTYENYILVCVWCIQFEFVSPYDTAQDLIYNMYIAGISRKTSYCFDMRYRAYIAQDVIYIIYIYIHISWGDQTISRKTAGDQARPTQLDISGQTTLPQFVFIGYSWNMHNAELIVHRYMFYKVLRKLRADHSCYWSAVGSRRQRRICCMGQIPYKNGGKKPGEENRAKKKTNEENERRKNGRRKNGRRKNGWENGRRKTGE